ncbi:multidrug effflux MFS transporter [Mucilaginibacter robiniae]|uniref:Multidrug effflux MFS transporter n=1 Tax=Mucilaginibacter robiniae TaxID=2728022 RepID=A0A7L5E6B4_9SPHI|nr:MFS transporter [Mucilaginibacter robiniae]QJD97917.1 multidrug effflux MFS transporter [Mucilaginibacter robiniae]
MTDERQHRIPTILAFSLLPLSGFATDIYIPSLPSMGMALHISNVQVQLTLTLFLISYGVSQLFIGSVLDSFGRFKLGLIALLVFAIASLVIAVSHNIYLICLMRIIHGITVAIIVVAKRAYFVDVYEGDRLKHYLSMFTIIWSAGPIVAPFIGGYLEHLFGWQSNFYFLAVLSAGIGLLDWLYSRETLKKPVAFHLRTIADIYANMIGTASFTLGIAMLGLAYTMVMVYNMTGPFIIEHQLKLTPVIAGYCSLLLGIAWMCGGFIGRATIKRPFFRKLVFNLSLQILFAVTMIGSLFFVSNLFTLLLFAFLIHACAGFTYNNYFTYCLSKFPQYAGISGGMTGGVVYILVSIISYGIVSVLPPKDEGHLSYSYLILGLLSALVMIAVFLTNRKQTSTLRTA